MRHYKNFENSVLLFARDWTANTQVCAWRSFQASGALSAGGFSYSQGIPNEIPGCRPCYVLSGYINTGDFGTTVEANSSEEPDAAVYIRNLFANSINVC